MSACRSFADRNLIHICRRPVVLPLVFTDSHLTWCKATVKVLTAECLSMSECDHPADRHCGAGQSSNRSPTSSPRWALPFPLDTLFTAYMMYDRRNCALKLVYLHELGPIMSAAEFVQDLCLGRSSLRPSRPSSKLPFAAPAGFVAFGYQDVLHGIVFFYLRREGLGGKGIYVPSPAADDVPIRPFHSAVNTNERRKPLLAESLRRLNLWPTSTPELTNAKASSP